MRDVTSVPSVLAALKSEVSVVYTRPAAIAPESFTQLSAVSVIGLFCKQTSSYRLRVNKVHIYKVQLRCKSARSVRKS